MGAADAYLTSTIDSHLAQSIRESLVVRSRLLARTAAAAPASLDDRSTWQDLARSFARDTGGPVAFIRRDGAVLGDSELPLGDLPRPESRVRTVEVERALENGHGWSDRLDAAGEQRLL